MGMENTALSGMAAAMANLDIISNNIANAHTPGFKKSAASFSDLFPSGDATGSQIGLGVQMTGALQSFAPGSPNPSDSPSDLSINSDGFFILQDINSAKLSYTRYGRFLFDNTTGFFTIGNQRLQGFPAVNGSIPAGSTPQDLQINTAAVPAVATDSITQKQLNLAASATAPAVAFDPNTATSYNFSSNVKMYDSLGSQHNLNLYYVKTATANEWSVHAYVDGTSVGTGSLNFTSAGLYSSSSGLTGLSFSPTTGATSPQTFDVLLSGATQFGDESGSASFIPSGHGAGAFSKYTIDSNGKVTALYTNGTSDLVGQIAIAKFQSPQGLQNIGNMSWVATTESGEAMVNQANSSKNVSQNSIEGSNVDLANEMVRLISAQNIFQANAQVASAFNQIMQTVTKL